MSDWKQKYKTKTKGKETEWNGGKQRKRMYNSAFVYGAVP